MSTQTPTHPMLPAWEVPDSPHFAAYGDLPHDLAIPDVSLWQLFADAAARWPDAVALKFLGAPVTWRELMAQADALAAGLEQLGVAPGDRVVIDLQNSTQFVVAYVAILRLDAVIVPVNPMYRGEELAHIIGDSGATVAIAATDIAAWVAEASDSLDTGLTALVTVDLAEAAGGRDAVEGLDIPADWKSWLTAPVRPASLAHGRVLDWAEAMRPGQAPTRPVASRGDALAQIGYTSGTSGRAKGCMTRHAALVHQVVCGLVWHDVRPGDATLVVIPLFHVTGLVMGLLCGLGGGATGILLPRWDREYALQAIPAENVTHWINVPTMVIDLLAAPGDAADTAMRRLRIIGGGGAAIPKPVEDKLRDTYGLDYITGYGLTESVAAACVIPVGRPKSGTVGVPFLGTDLRIIESVPGPVAVPRVLPAGEAGEIVLRGPQITPGYWHDPQATAEATVVIDGEEFFRTGDIGILDEQGYVSITDRLKRLINASGFKVSPAEVEQVFYGHDAVREVCVIRTSDARRGESVKAIIVLKDGWAGRVTEDELIAWSKERLAAYKYPRSIDFVDSLPHSAAGKLMWREVQDDYDKRAAT